MEQRIKAVRKALGLTQAQMADELKIAARTIQGYEYGKRSPSMAFIQLLCVKYGINQHWLLTGEGDMFTPEDRFNEIAEFTRSLLQHEPDAFQVRLISALAKLNVEQWELLESIAKEMVENKKG